MKPLSIRFAPAVVLAIASFAPAQPVIPQGAASGDLPAKVELPPDVAATVNGEPISMNEVYDKLFRQYGANMLEQMIRAKAARLEAKRLGVTHDEKAVAEQIDRWKQSYLGRFNNDEKAADEVLRKQGTSWEQTLATMREHQITENLWRQILKKTKSPDDEALKRLFDQRYGKDGNRVEVAHILLSGSATDERYAKRYTRREHYSNYDGVVAEARALAADLAKRAHGGEDFAELAKAHSDDWSKQNGGKLGAFYQNRFGSAFDAAIEGGAIGEVVGPIEGDGSFLVGKIEPAEFDTVYRARHIFLYYGKKDREKVNEHAQALLEKLRGGADFAALAAAESDDPLTKKKGGQWPPFKGGQKVPQLTAALDAVSPGEVAGPVVTPYGVHVMRLDGKEQVARGTKKAASVIVVSTQFEKVREKKLEPIITADLEATAATIRAELGRGVAFADLARKHSTEKLTAERGGAIQNYSEHRYGPAFHAVVESLEPGQVSATLVKSNQGYHIVKLLSRQSTTFEAIKDELFAESLKEAPSPMELQQVQQRVLNGAAVVRRK